MRRGDRVKLTRSAAKPMMTKLRARKTNWYARSGTVIRISRATDTVTVLWDDRASTDGWPLRALQKIDESSHGLQGQKEK
jgi:hypothetical protein